jgi:tetratricopeptide (TPR) repeat protein
VPKTALGSAKQGHDYSQLVANATEIQMDDLEAARNLENEGLRLLENGSYEQAIVFLERALHFYQSQHSENFKAIVLNNLIGSLHHLLGRYEDAVVYQNRALEIFENNPDTINDYNLKVTVLVGLGRAYEALGNLEQAVRSYVAAAEIAQGLNDYETAARHFVSASRIYYSIGDVRSSQYYFNGAEQLLLSIPDNEERELL